jgi:hypothetical protein
MQRSGLSKPNSASFGFRNEQHSGGFRAADEKGLRALSGPFKRLIRRSSFHALPCRRPPLPEPICRRESTHRIQRPLAIHRRPCLKIALATITYVLTEPPRPQTRHKPLATRYFFFHLMSSPATSYTPLVTPSDDEVLVRVEGVSKKFCRSLADKVGCGG